MDVEVSDPIHVNPESSKTLESNLVGEKIEGVLDLKGIKSRSKY